MLQGGREFQVMATLKVHVPTIPRGWRGGGYNWQVHKLLIEPKTFLDNDGEDKEINLWTVDIIEDSEDLPQASGRIERPDNVNVDGLDWSSQGSDLEVL